MDSPDSTVVGHDLVPEYNAGGVDLSLVRWMLTLTPAERLELLDDRIRDINAIRERNAA